MGTLGGGRDDLEDGRQRRRPGRDSCPRDTCANHVRGLCGLRGNITSGGRFLVFFGSGFFRPRVRGVVAPGHFARLSIELDRGGMVSGVDTWNDERQNVFGGGCVGPFCLVGPGMIILYPTV